MKHICLIVFYSICYSLIGHKLLAQGKGANLNNNNVVGWNNIPTNLASEKIEYSDVKGTCFWKDEWLPARVFMDDGAVYQLPKAKLNFYSGGIHYINDAGVELAARSGVKSIIFYSASGASQVGVFKILNGLIVNFGEVYAEVLSDGKMQLLKTTVVKLVKRETDPLLKTVEWTFEPRETYFIQNGEVRELKGISKSHIFALIDQQDGDQEWLKTQKNKLKNEQDVIAFLTYRNSLVK